MPKQIPTEELEAIHAAIAHYSEGVGAEGVRSGISFSLPARTLQRRLSLLIDQGRIASKGSGKGTRYCALPTSNIAGQSMRISFPSMKVAEPKDGSSLIPLSSVAREIRAIVNSPLAARTPVGYQATFLESYVPNQSAYLSEESRRNLSRVGQVGVTILPAGTYIRQVMDRLLIDLSWNSSRLEGNTYSLLETERLLHGGESPAGKGAEETQMILNHKAAIEMLAEQADEVGFNRYTICNLHALLSDNLLVDPAACGRLRSRPVGIGGTVYHPLEVPQQIEEGFESILAKAEAISDPFEQAFFVMVHLPYLQPFEDVNKRVSRLAANLPMVKANFCPLSFIDVPQDDYVNGLIGVYELNRVDYLRDVFVWAYQRSASRYSAVLQSLGDPDPFRLQYRSQIGDFVRAIVIGGMDKTRASKWVAANVVEVVPEQDRARFTEVVKTELSCLHEGNIARYRLRPGEFRVWVGEWG